MSYTDPITGGADMSITFSQDVNAKWLIRLFKTSKIFGSRFGGSIFFFKEDLHTVKDITESFNDIFPIEYEIKTVKYMSVEDAIDGTIKELCPNQVVTDKKKRNTIGKLYEAGCGLLRQITNAKNST